MAGPQVGASIRRAGGADSARLALLGSATFLASYADVLSGDDLVLHCQQKHGQDFYADWLERDRATIWIAETEAGSAPIGYLVLDQSMLTCAGDDDIEIHRLYVLQGFQGLGIGSRLIGMAIETACELGRRRLLVGVYGKNEKAIGFYQAQGFSMIADRQFLIGRTWHDDRVMSFDLAIGAPASAF